MWLLYLSTGQENLISETEIGHVFLKFLTALRAEFNVNIVNNSNQEVLLFQKDVLHSL